MKGPAFDLCRRFVETRPPQLAASMAVCPIHQANFLLDRQLRRLEKAFLEKGGLRERMIRVRSQVRDQRRKGAWEG